MALGRNSRFPGAVPVTPAPLRAGGEASLLRQSCWWVGGPGWWLWDFTNHQTTAYVIVNNRARAPVTATFFRHVRSSFRVRPVVVLSVLASGGRKPPVLVSVCFEG